MAIPIADPLALLPAPHWHGACEQWCAPRLQTEMRLGIRECVDVRSAESQGAWGMGLEKSIPVCVVAEGRRAGWPSVRVLPECFHW